VGLKEVPDDDDDGSRLGGGSPVRSNMRAARRFIPLRRLDMGCPSMKESTTHAFVPSETGV